jgi:hypothetical protein
MSFADEITTFVARAEEMKAHATPKMAGAGPRVPVRVSEFARDVAPTPVEPVDEPEADSAWASPFEWRKADAPGDRPAARPSQPPEERLPLVSSAPLAVVAEEEELRLEEAAQRHAQYPNEREELRLEAEAAAKQQRESRAGGNAGRGGT